MYTNTLSEEAVLSVSSFNFEMPFFAARDSPPSLDESRPPDVVVRAELEVRRVHLHDERLVPVLLLLGAPVVAPHECAGAEVRQAGGAGEGVAPGKVVEVGVEQPVAVPAAEAEDDHGQEEARGWEKMWKSILLTR